MSATAAPPKEAKSSKIAEEPPKKTIKAKIGMTVQWIPQGNLANRPQAAVILDILPMVGANVVMLKVFGTHHDQTLGNAIRHLDDPYHQTHQDALKVNGAWRAVSE